MAGHDPRAIAALRPKTRRSPKGNLLPMRVGLLTLGCDKNTVDAEYAAGLLTRAGHECLPVHDPEALPPLLDVVVVTTCGFIADARQQSVEALLLLAESKRRTGYPKRVVAAGCLTQRYGRELAVEIPELDAVAGVGRFEDLVRQVAGPAANRPGSKAPVLPRPRVEVKAPLPRRALDAHPYAFLKIADGCNHACTFCAIPLMKGPLRSTPGDILLEEARALVGRGAREIVLVAQDISVYGTDRRDGYRLPHLLRDLCRLDGDFRVRCLYCYPGGVTDALLDVMAREPKIAPYLDIPLQHLDPDLLRRMKRPLPGMDVAALVRRIRDALPGVALRTTVLVGSPGETPAAHKRLLAGLQELAFEWLGAFPYSREEGTPAAEAPRQVGEATREKRWRAVMEAQAAITGAFNRGRVGKTLRVLIEDYDAVRQCYVGRSPAEAPEVDGAVFVTADKPLDLGGFVRVRVESADVYDISGRALDGPGE